MATDPTIWTPGGEQGPPGPQGPVGPAGPQGEKGDTGAQGPVGPQGPIGPRGATGATGPQGLAGIQGPAGIPGDDGTTIINGEGDPTATDGADGDYYLDVLTYTLWGPKFTGTWPAEGVELIGPQGLQGPQGIQGLQGPQGIQGEKGDTGNTGAQGIQGVQGPEGPQGDVGPQGPVGPEGPQGPPGVDGAITVDAAADGGIYGRQNNGWVPVPTGGGGGAVDSVNGQVGAVTLDAADVGAEPAVPDNLEALTAPTSADDETAGYAPKSNWVDTSVTPVEIYKCVDATAGAAVWLKTSLTLDELGSAALQDDSRYAKLVGANNFDTMPTVGGSPIVESGSNSNGEWTRWADGTQDCRVIRHPLIFENSSNISFVWTYPIPFINDPVVVPSLDYSIFTSSIRNFPTIQAPYAIDIMQTRIGLYSSANFVASDVTNLPMSGYASGRWK